MNTTTPSDAAVACPVCLGFCGDSGPTCEERWSLEKATAHLASFDGVNFQRFNEWVTLNPGGVCRLIDALLDRLPEPCRDAAIDRIGMDRKRIMRRAHEIADARAALRKRELDAGGGSDGCTESNCQRCMTESYARGDMKHAGIGSYPTQPTTPPAVEGVTDWMPTIDTVRKIDRALIRLGHSTPESLEIMAIQIDRWLVTLCRELDALLDGLSATAPGEPKTPAVEGGRLSAEDMFERYVQDGIARSPEPLRELGRYLADHLDEDEFQTANALILQLATTPPGEAVSGDLEQQARDLFAEWHRKKGCGQQVVDDCLSGSIAMPPLCMELLIEALAKRGEGDVEAYAHRNLPTPEYADKAIADLRTIVARWNSNKFAAINYDTSQERRIIRECLKLAETLRAAIPPAVEVTDDQITAAMLAPVPGSDIAGEGSCWNVASFIDSKQPPFENIDRRDVIRAALTASRKGAGE